MAWEWKSGERVFSPIHTLSGMPAMLSRNFDLLLVLPTYLSMFLPGAQALLAGKP